MRDSTYLCVSPDGVQLFRSINLLDIHTGINSRPIPSPGIKPIRNNLQAIRLKNIFQKKIRRDILESWGYGNQ